MPDRAPGGTILLALLIGLVLALIWFGPVLVVRAHAATVCMASYYGAESGSITASGERFRPDGLTAAMRSRAFGRRLRVTIVGIPGRAARSAPLVGRSVIVRHNDYGPAAYTGRCIDLSRGAARALGMIHNGTARVRIDVLTPSRNR
jgi:rare lipoprotein A